MRQGEVWLGESAVQTVGEHAPSPADGFLGRLADQENRAAPAVFMLSEPPGRADPAGHVHIVAAGVHHADLTALRVSCFDFACVGKPRLLNHGERVHVGTNKHNGPPPVLDQPHDAEFPHVGRHLGAGPPQLGRQPGGGLHFSVRKLGMSMQIHVELQQLSAMGVEPGVSRRRLYTFELGLGTAGSLKTCKENKNTC